MVHPTSAVSRADDHTIEETSWGRLVWMVSEKLGNSTTMTVGRCYIEPGMENPRHFHPNCDEVLHVLQGTIEHSLDDQKIMMSAGDTISIPQGTFHNARNVGEQQAVFVISFSSADRQTIGEE
ncbi:cupin domain-containing protein [Actinopolymorpha sp. B17G11]|uniref:cupin domain-containing protein n=1 Tax=unclassified Actinopolymorpha TaxID=2627063 RepID=UPI0032D946DB